VLLARTVTLADQAQLDLKASPAHPATMALLAKMESATLVDPVLKEKLALLATQVIQIPSKLYSMET